MSPFAGLAVHAADAAAQAAPYVLLLGVVPMHYATYEALLGVSSLWCARPGGGDAGGLLFHVFGFVLVCVMRVFARARAHVSVLLCLCVVCLCCDCLWLGVCLFVWGCACECVCLERPQCPRQGGLAPPPPRPNRPSAPLLHPLLPPTGRPTPTTTSTSACPLCWARGTTRSTTPPTGTITVGALGERTRARSNRVEGAMRRLSSILSHCTHLAWAGLRNGLAPITVAAPTQTTAAFAPPLARPRPVPGADGLAPRDPRDARGGRGETGGGRGRGPRAAAAGGRSGGRRGEARVAPPARWLGWRRHPPCGRCPRCHRTPVCCLYTPRPPEGQSRGR
jgi:hypothetical protein